MRGDTVKNVSSWEGAIKRLANYQPIQLPLPNHFREAAVLIPIIKKKQPELILTLRSDNLSSHGGEVAFPGGKKDPEDQTLQQTALRETKEEINLQTKQLKIVGCLQTRISKHNIKVSPFVALIDEPISYYINQCEIASVFTVPLAYFQNTPHDAIKRTDYAGNVVYVPCYYYKEFKIWGLTAMMIEELIQVIT